MSRIYNFSAGPSMLPVSVLEQAAKDLVDYQGTGMSVMEMSHRTPVYEDICLELSVPSAVVWAFPTITPCFSCKAALPCSSPPYR